MDVSYLKRDSAKLSKGEWVKDIPGMGDVEFLVRGYTSPEAMSLRASLERAVPITRRAEDGTVDPTVASEILCRVLSEVVLIDVKNLSEGGKALKVDEVKKMILHPDYEPLADAVFAAASLVDRMRVRVKETVAKN
jgi:hypothetical protein